MSNETSSRKSAILGRQLMRRVRLISLIAILGFAAVVFTGLLGSLQGTQGQLNGVGAETSNTIDDLLSSIRDDLMATTDALALTDNPDETLRRMLNRQSAIFELLLIEPQGEVPIKRRRVGEAESAALEEQPWLATVEIGSVYVGPVDYEEFGVPFVNMAAGVFDEAGNFSGTLLAKVDLTALWDTITKLSVGESGYVYVTDESGQLLAYPTLRFVLEGANLEEETGRTPEDIAESDFNIYTALNGKRVFAAGSPLAAAPWFVIVEQPLGEALRIFIGLSVGLLVMLAVTGGLLYNALLFTRRRIASPLLLLREGVEMLQQGKLDHRIEVQTQDEFGDLASTLNAMATQLQEMIGTLEQRVAERTRGLQTAAEVARATTSVLEPGQLLRQVVELARERFDLYYVGLFLIEEEPESGRSFAVLSAGTGEAGEQMMIQRHRLEVGGNSMIGQCTARAEARIALDVGEEAVHFDNPLLPETRSEMALPLRSRGEVIGAMTVQSKKAAAFDEADIAVMQTMADQVAVALDNARLFSKTQETLAKMESTHRRYLERAWTEYAAREATSGYEQIGADVKPIGERTLPEAKRALEERKPMILSGDGDEQSDDLSALVAPIMLRGQPIGALGFRRDKEGQREWSDEDVSLVEEIAEQLALAADNLRLLEETQRRAARERLTGEITDRMRRAVDMDDLMQSAVAEIAEALDTPGAFVQLGAFSAEPLDEEIDAESSEGTE